MRKRIFALALISVILMTTVVQGATTKYVGRVWGNNRIEGAIDFDVDVYYSYNRETTSYIDLYSFSMYVMNYGRIEPTSTEYKAHDKKFVQNLHAYGDDLYGIGTNNRVRTEYFVSSYGWINSTVFQKNDYVRLSIGAGPEDWGHAGFDVFIYDDEYEKQPFNGSSVWSSAELTAANMFNKAYQMQEPVIEKGFTHVPIAVEDITEYEILQDTVFATDSSFDNIISIAEQVLIDDTVVYQLEGEYEAGEVYIQAPVLLKTEDVPAVWESLQVDNEHILELEGEDWLNIENIRCDETEEVTAIIVEYSSVDANNWNVLPRTAKLNINGELVDVAESIMYFGEDNSFIKGILKFYIQDTDNKDVEDLEISINEVLKIID